MEIQIDLKEIPGGVDIVYINDDHRTSWYQAKLPGIGNKTVRLKPKNKYHQRIEVTYVRSLPKWAIENWGNVRETGFNLTWRLEHQDGVLIDMEEED